MFLKRGASSFFLYHRSGELGKFGLKGRRIFVFKRKRQLFLEQSVFSVYHRLPPFNVPIWVVMIAAIITLTIALRSEMT